VAYIEGNEKAMIYRIQTRVKALEFKKKALRSWANKADPENVVVQYEYEDLGWFVTFEDSHESLFVGKTEPPDLQIGTVVDIIIVPRPKT
jgi:hypothetical protein